MLPPHELKNKAFSKSMRGYNPIEVDEYIDFLTQKYTELYRENDELERKLRAAVARLDELKEDEDSIRSTLIDAKRAANKIKADANERAESIIRAAKDSCNAILSDFNQKIDFGRDTIAELQRDAFELKKELFARYSEHITFIEKLTEEMDEASIPAPNELRRAAIAKLKASIKGEGYEPLAPVDESENAAQAQNESEKDIDFSEALDSLVDAPIIEDDADDGLEPMDFVSTAAADEEFIEISRELLSTDKHSLKNSVAELNRQYKANADEDIINTPDSDIGDDESYLDFVKSVTGKSSESNSKDADFNMLFDSDNKKKK